MSRTVFFVSDRTGITVETLGHSLLTQFENLQFKQVTLPFIDSVERAREAATVIARTGQESGAPIVFSTLVDPEVRAVVAGCGGVFFDFFDTFIIPLEQALQSSSSHAVGRSHAMTDKSQYNVRIDAVNFAMATDDGTITRNYPQADIIITGVSRSGKTPTCLYLALQFGIRAANYPLTEEDMADQRLPVAIAPYRDRLFGLTIDAERLQQIRTERKPDSRYASLKQCEYEVRQAEALYRAHAIPFLDTSIMSIEEIATTILHRRGLQRRLY